MSQAIPLDLTIKSELDKIKNVKDKFPAVNLVAALLRHITVNVNQALRDVHTTGQILVRSNKVYESIIEVMEKLDALALADNVDEATLESSWNQFDDYTTAIPILERILLDLPHTTAVKPRTLTPPDVSTQEAVSYIALWLAERQKLKAALEALKDPSLQKVLKPDSIKTIVAEYISHRAKDDSSLIRVLDGYIKNTTLSDRDISAPTAPAKAIPYVVRDVKRLIADLGLTLANKPVQEEMSAIVVRAYMTVYIPFAVIANPNVDAGWKLYLKGGDLWSAIKDLLAKAKNHLDRPTNDLESAFNNVEALLLKLGDITVNTAKEMLSLLKIVPHIPRPYNGRTATLVKAIYHLDLTSRSEKKKKLVVHRQDLKNTMVASHAELTKVKESPYDIKTFSLESSDYAAKKGAILKLLMDIEPLFTTFEVSSDWQRHQAAFGDSVSTDEKHMTEGKKILVSA